VKYGPHVDLEKAAFLHLGPGFRIGFPMAGQRKEISQKFPSIPVAEVGETSIFPPLAAGRPRFRGFPGGFLDPKHGLFEAQLPDSQ
jgi:hypothetical protein